MAVKIIISRDNKPIDQYVVTQDSILIGRKSECDISVKDPAASGNHAKIQRAGANWLIEDLDSTNGTRVGTRPVKKRQALKPNDVVHIGEHQLQFVIEPEKAGQSNDASKEKTSRQSTSAPSRGSLKVISGQQAGDVISLDEALTTIGQPGVQVAAISRRPQGYFIIHVNGGKDRERVPVVNGEPTGFKSRKLEPGDKVEVAGIEMEFVGE